MPGKAFISEDENAEKRVENEDVIARSHCVKPNWKRDTGFQVMLMVQKRVSYMKGLWGAAALGRVLERQ